jgi:hypothetical protein
MKKKRKLYHCKQCKKTGHNRATCADLVHLRTCGQCKLVGHDAHDCPMRKPCLACGSREHSTRKHPGGVTVTLIAGKRVVIQPLAQPGTTIAHVAYEPKTFTLEVAYRGPFTLHRYRYSPVPPMIVEQLRGAARPDDFVTRVLKPAFLAHYVVRRAR